MIDVALERNYNGSRTNLEDDLWATIQDYPDRIDRAYLQDCPEAGMNPACPILWGEESWDRALHWAYTMDKNRSVDVEDGSTLTEDYYETRWPIVQDRLMAGGVRLAATLEAIRSHIVNVQGLTGVDTANVQGLTGVDTASQVGSLVGWSHHVLRSD